MNTVLFVNATIGFSENLFLVTLLFNQVLSSNYWFTFTFLFPWNVPFYIPRFISLQGFLRLFLIPLLKLTFSVFKIFVPERLISSFACSFMASFFAFIERVTTEVGNIPGNFSANFSVFSSYLGFSTTLGPTITFSPVKSFPYTGNEGLIPITMLPFIKLDLIFTSWSGTSKTPISTPEISTFAPVKLFSVRGSTLNFPQCSQGVLPPNF